MVKKPPRDTKIGGVKSTRETTHVDPTEAVGGVGNVKATTGVTGVTRSGSIGSRKPTRTMTLEEREEIFKLINEEAAKMFSDTGVSKTKQELVETAVRMAVDSGLLPAEDSDEGNDPKKAPRKPPGK